MNKAEVVRRRGRPRGHPQTRARIVAAAEPLFLEHGYRATTVRAVAAAAGVDSALISYHFGSKRGLFGEVTQIQCARALDLGRAFAGDRAGLADRLLQLVTELWDATEVNRLALENEEVMRAFREFLEGEVLTRLAEYLGGRDATRRALAAVTLIGGLIFTRYLNPLPLAAALPSAEVCRTLAPALRAALAPTPVAARGGGVSRPGV
ncbi:TetR/AcrR family transcriptional regulator [Streptacidiphilus pinicola]|uniref:TetR/AcrR family transcriptional regulator n=1 Tax=Streptacidiphilus pinicola TaxID=2219663 RepID=A0A2X0J629_9ACTN|nr:TetR family transcriptional regulator [Streptacidiphilus pinicola]RAG82858.1 TetR/AcrR family transcriptional regulator [Streptacidiphilus pinicola]